MLEIHWGSGSPFAWRVLLALEIKDIPYESHLIEFSKKQHKEPAFLALNPRGKVPVIKDGDFTLSESLAILAYLDRKVPEPPLFGRTAAESGLVWKAINESVNYLDPPAIRIVGPLFFNKTEEKADDMRAALKELHAELRLLETTLAKQRWVVGSEISAADCVVFPAIESILRAAGKDAAKAFDLGIVPLEKTYPALAAWRERVRALPGYERTYPPHWRTAPQPVAVA
jgi:glutathione S-transferase